MSTSSPSVRRPHSNTVLPPEDATSLDPLAALLQQDSARLIAPDGYTVDLPPEVYDVLVDVVAALKSGQAVTVAPMSTRLSTSQAADLLGISRPTLIKLLEDGAIPYEQPRRHRLLRLDDVLRFRDERQRNRTAALAEMTRQAVADGLYEDSAEDYAEVLREIRRGG